MPDNIVGFGDNCLACSLRLTSNRTSIYHKICCTSHPLSCHYLYLCTPILHLSGATLETMPVLISRQTRHTVGTRAVKTSEQ